MDGRSRLESEPCTLALNLFLPTFQLKIAEDRVPPASQPRKSIPGAGGRWTRVLVVVLASGARRHHGPRQAPDRPVYPASLAHYELVQGLDCSTSARSRASMVIIAPTSEYRLSTMAHHSQQGVWTTWARGASDYNNYGPSRWGRRDWQVVPVVIVAHVSLRR